MLPSGKPAANLLHHQLFGQYKIKAKAVCVPFQRSCSFAVLFSCSEGSPFPQLSNREMDESGLATTIPPVCQNGDKQQPWKIGG
jgi:hypothetical protein